MQTKYLILDVKTVPSDGSGVWTGYAATFSNIDRDNETIAPGAFTRSLAAWHKRREYPPVFWNHDASDPDALIGRLTSVQETSTGLLVSGKLNLSNELAMKCYERLLDGTLSTMSIGYVVEHQHEREDGVVVLDQLDLIEVSLTPVPANPEAAVLSVKSRPRRPNVRQPRQHFLETEHYKHQLDVLEGVASPEPDDTPNADEFVRDERATREKERADAERLAAKIRELDVLALLPSEADRDAAETERFTRERDLIARRDAEREREGAVRQVVDAARREETRHDPKVYAP